MQFIIECENVSYSLGSVMDVCLYAESWSRFTG